MLDPISALSPHGPPIIPLGIDGGGRITYSSIMHPAPPSPLLTLEQVRDWASERDSLAVERRRIDEQWAELNRKLEAVAAIFPDIFPQHAAVSIAIEQPPRAPKVAMPPKFTLNDAILGVLKDQKGARTPRWVVEQINSRPEYAQFKGRSPSTYTNALSRLKVAERLHGSRGSYYLPEIYQQIQSGELSEERVENAPNFNSEMWKCVSALGDAFTAKDVIQAGRSVPFILERLTNNPAAIYSWLSRCVYNQKLVKTGDLYSLPGSSRPGRHDFFVDESNPEKGDADVKSTA